MEAGEIGEQSSEFTLLTLQEQSYLKDATENLSKQLIKDYPEKLPDGVIFPDVSARPLASLFRPIFSTIAQQRGVIEPIPFFFQLESLNMDIRTADFFYKVFPNTNLEHAHIVASKKLGKIERQVMQTNDKNVREELEEEGYEVEALLEQLEKYHPQNAEKIRQVWKDRANEIQTFLQGKGIASPQLIIIDDAIHNAHSQWKFTTKIIT